MRFTEREMTVAVDVLTRARLAAGLPPWRRGKADAAWDRLGALHKHTLRTAVGDTVLPALIALPERPTIGAPPAFTDEEYAAAAEHAAQSLVERRKPGRWERLSEAKRAALIRTTAQATREAVAAMPVRSDPAAPTVPDHPPEDL